MRCLDLASDILGARKIGFAVVAGTLCMLAASGASAAEAKQLPNIILCMADDQGWGDVGYYGNPVPKTPTLDAMAAANLRLDRFYAAAPVCSPTRGSVLTGRHPNRFGCFTWGHTLRPQEVTVAEALKKAGYRTGHFGKWHLGSVRAQSPVSPGGSGFDTWFSAPNFYENDPPLSHNGKVVMTKGESSQATVDRAMEFIKDSTKQQTPFLAVIWFGSPHTPHEATEEFLKLYPDLTKRQQHYYGEISGIDSAMGSLRRSLREMKIADDTLLWYTSDNGPQGPAGKLGSAGGLKGRKGTLWEGGIRVPTIIEWPARIKEHRISTLSSGTIDIYPTLLEIAGVSIPNQPVLDGESLLPLIDGADQHRASGQGFWVYPAKGRPMRAHAMLEQLAKDQAAGKETPLEEHETAAAAEIKKIYSQTDLPGNAAWIEGDYKLHRRVAKKGINVVSYSLFNLKKDPAESNNLAKAEPQKLQQLQAKLAAWQKSVIGSLNGEDYK